MTAENFKQFVLSMFVLLTLVAVVSLESNPKEEVRRSIVFGELPGATVPTVRVGNGNDVRVTRMPRVNTVLQYRHYRTLLFRREWNIAEE